MKLALSIFLVLLSFILGFFYAGMLGAFLFGFFNTFAWVIFTRKTREKIVFRVVLSVLALGSLGYVGMVIFGLVGAEKMVQGKVQGIKNELTKAGHKPVWFIISQKRYSFFNDLLANSVKNGKSKHLQGKAIDLYVIDINSDGKYDKIDFDLILQASQKYEKMNHQAKGNTIHYFGKGYFTQHMVHIDID